MPDKHHSALLITIQIYFYWARDDVTAYALMAEAFVEDEDAVEILSMYEMALTHEELNHVKSIDTDALLKSMEERFLRV